MTATNGPFPLGARLDYSVGVAIRQAGNLSSGATLTIDLEGGPLELRRAGQGFHLVAPGQPDRALPADDLAAFVWAAVLEHVRATAAAALALATLAGRRQPPAGGNPSAPRADAARPAAATRRGAGHAEAA